MADGLLSSTPYDDVFKTLLNDCRKLIIPVINEMFGEKYTGEETIQFSPNEHFLNQQGGVEEQRITDSSFAVFGETKKRYHLECQSTVDNSILIRIFEYDAQIALDQDSEVAANRITVSFPHTAVLFLRSQSTMPDEMEVVIRTPGGEVKYSVPAMKVTEYSIEEILAKNLERIFLWDLSESNRAKGVHLANEICRDYRREGQFFDEILEETRR